MLKLAKQAGFSDKQVGRILGIEEDEVRDLRLSKGIRPWVKQVMHLLGFNFDFFFFFCCFNTEIQLLLLHYVSGWMMLLDLNKLSNLLAHTQTK